MKFRTLLLASAAVLVAAPAFAAEDITAAFFTPAKGHILSDTTLVGGRFKTDNGENEGVDKNLRAMEEVTFGVTDNFAVFGGIANYFDVDGEYNNDHNFAYELGAKYNMTYGKVLGQVAVAYHTWDPRSFFGKSGEGIDYETNRWQKAVEGTVKLGYVLDCGLTPYTTFSALGSFDHDHDQGYSWFAGAHKMLDKVALDGGFRYDFGNGEYNGEAWYVQAEADYFVKDNMTVGVFGDYYLGGAGRKDVEYGYTLGLNAKVLF